MNAWGLLIAALGVTFLVVGVTGNGSKLVALATSGKAATTATTTAATTPATTVNAPVAT